MGIMDGSGSNPNPGADQPSNSPSPPDNAELQRPRILIVEDNPADVFLICRAIQNANLLAELQVLKDGEQAVQLVAQLEADPASPALALVILDINLPKRHGGEVLERIRRGRRCGDVPVIAISTSQSPEDREHMSALGANSYFHKPSQYAEFMKLGDLVKSFLTRP
jgi:CheY-like chemotaxis protein